MTASLCLHGPEVKLNLTPYYTRKDWPGKGIKKKGMFFGLFSKRTLWGFFAFKWFSFFIKDQGELLNEKKNHIGKDVKPKTICIYSMFKVFYFFIF